MRALDIEEMDEEMRKKMAARFLLWDGGAVEGERLHSPTSVEGMFGSMDLRSFPNPAIENSSVHVSRAESGSVSLKVFDMNGTMVKSLIDKEMPAGEYLTL